MDKIRKIIHVDMDAFFASVEQRDNPDLKGKPVAVGGSSNRGVVAAASYEARKFGVHSAMPTHLARKLCKNLIFVPARFDRYREISNEIREIFHQYTDFVEPLSLDEAYLDISQLCEEQSIWASKLAREIRKKIWEQTGLTASAGISFNKFLAKTASDQNKPNGQFTITPEQAEEFVAELPIGKFHGIGPATEKKMLELSIGDGASLKTKSREFLVQNFGKSGEHYYWIARGIDPREVEPNRIRKSSGAETTFARNIEDINRAKQELKPLLAEVWQWAEENKKWGKTLTVKVKFENFEQITRSHSDATAILSQNRFIEIAELLLERAFSEEHTIRLLGVSISGFEVEKINQLSFIF